MSQENAREMPCNSKGSVALMQEREMKKSQQKKREAIKICHK